jgi:hypothetical protein
MVAIEELTRVAREMLEAENSLERAGSRLHDLFPGEPDRVGRVITMLVGGDVFFPGEVPEPGTLRAKFWPELSQDR